MNHTSVVVHQEAPFPHAVHVVLCILACRAWLPVYVLHAVLASRGGGTLLAFLVNVPLCLGLVGVGGCVVVTVVGGAVGRPDPALPTAPAGRPADTPTGPAASAPAERQATADWLRQVGLAVGACVDRTGRLPYTPAGPTGAPTLS